MRTYFFPNPIRKYIISDMFIYTFYTEEILHSLNDFPNLFRNISKRCYVEHQAKMEKQLSIGYIFVELYRKKNVSIFHRSNMFNKLFVT